MDEDLYDILGLGWGSDEDDIKRAYRKLSSKWHPDRNNSPEATSTFQRINKAYSILIDPKKRKIYNESKKIEEIDYIESSANNILSILYKDLVLSHGYTLSNINYITLIKNHITALKANCEKDKVDFEQKLSRLHIFIRDTKVTPGIDLEETFSDEKATLQTQIAHAKEALIVFNLCKEKLDKWAFQYTGDTPFRPFVKSLYFPDSSS